jgi:quinol monooxygenase YgiN
MRALVSLVLGVAMTASAHAAAPTFYTVTYVEVGPAAAAQGAALVRQHGAATRQAPGAVRVETLQRVDRPSQLVLVVAWTEAGAFESHQAAPATAEFQARLAPLLAAPNDTRLHGELSVGSASSGPPGALSAVTHVDVIPPRKDDAVVALRQLAEENRREAGNVRFDVIQQTNRPNHFTVVEVWRDRPAFEAHAMAPHVRRFREQLAPMTGALYDERLYRSID